MVLEIYRKPLVDRVFFGVIFRILARRAQDGAQMAKRLPRWPKTGLRWPKIGIRQAQNCPRQAQDWPLMVQNRPKMAQDGAKIAPKSPHDGSERGLRRRKREPGHPKTAKKA